VSDLFTRNRLLGLGIAALIFAGDQFVKWLVIEPLQLRQRYVIDLLPFFDLRYTENRGVSLGMFEATSAEMRWILVGITALIALVSLAARWEISSIAASLAMLSTMPISISGISAPS
jgi:signal peptidase II